MQDRPYSECSNLSAISNSLTRPNPLLLPESPVFPNSSALAPTHESVSVSLPRHCLNFTPTPTQPSQVLAKSGSYPYSEIKDRRMEIREFEDSGPPDASKIISEATRRERALSIEHLVMDESGGESELLQNLEGLYEKRAAMLSELKV